jgi:hypothetical protein
MAKRESSCPLCGARLMAEQVLDASEEIVGAGILGCRCPFCQGYFEVLPGPDCLEIGFLRDGRFDAVVSLPAAGLAALRDAETNGLRLKLGPRLWKFEEE